MYQSIDMLTFAIHKWLKTFLKDYSILIINIARAPVNLIYQVVPYLRSPKALQMYKNLTQFTASDLPTARF